MNNEIDHREWTTRIFEERESVVRSYSRSFPAIFAKAKGATIYDTEGRAYIDFLVGAGSLNYGHNHDFIKEALIAYLVDDGIAHGLDLHTTAKATFLEEFTDRVLEPRGLDYRVQFTGPTGTNAVEAALKIARKSTGRSGVFSFMGGYHGHSLGALATTSNRSHRAASGTSLNDVTFLPYPNRQDPEFDTLGYLRALLEDTHSGVEVPAAIILETVQGEGGVVVAPAEWLEGLRTICDTYGIVLICDEVQTGCGRTGPFFSFERAGIVPDVVTVSKSISGYGLPMALTLVRPELDVLAPGDHTGTFRGNQLAFITATAALALYEKEDIEVATRANETLVASVLARDVASLDARIEIRGIGMMFGVDTKALDDSGELAGKISRRCFEDGLIIERAGRNDTVLKLLPPLTIETRQLLDGLAILRDATASCLNA